MSTQSTADDSLRMTQLLFGFTTSQALYVVARLGVANALLDGPRGIGELADATSADPDALGRMIRTLAPLGVFRTEADGKIAVTPFGATLAPGEPGSVHGIARYLMETHYQPFGELLRTAQTGETAANHLYGMNFTDWIARDPERVAVQSAAMVGVSDGWRGPFLSGYRLPPGDVVADLGAADGSMLARLLAQAPGRRGIVFDLPEVIPAAEKVLEAHGVDDRVSVQSGSFFEEVPAADVYLLSMVLHDWNNEAAMRILATIANAARPGARLVVIEHIVPPGDGPDFSKATDLVMLAMTGGKERTAAAYTDLLATAGFTVDAIKESGTPFSAIEATLRE
jgi:predicted methyltransferase